MSVVGLVLLTVAFFLALSARISVGDSIDFVKQFCCRTGWEFANGHACEAGKISLLDKLQGNASGANYVALIVAELTVLGVATWGGWIMFPIMLLVKSKHKNIGLYIVCIVGIVAVVLTSIDLGYSAYENWEQQFDAAGCCCCWNANTSQCDLNSAVCNNTASSCYTRDALTAHGLDTNESKMPQHDQGSSWPRRSIAIAVLTIVGYSMFVSKWMQRQREENANHIYTSIAPIQKPSSSTLSF